MSRRTPNRNITHEEARAMTSSVDTGKLRERLEELQKFRSQFVNNNANIVAQATNALMQYNQGLADLDARINEISLIIGVNGETGESTRDSPQ